MNIFKKTFFELLAFVFILIVVVLILNYFVDENAEGDFLEASVKGKTIFLEIADNSYSQTIGLSGREYLEEDKGMIFIYEKEMEELSFWMKNTYIPLDMAFLDKDFLIVFMYENVPICEEDLCPKYPSEKKAQYVIEMNAGWFGKNDVGVGDKVEIINQDQSDS
jgi:uncharacterized protein